MQRIQLLVQKLEDLSGKEKEIGTIDIDLMLDYTRVIYADLLELRKRLTTDTLLENTPPQVTQPAAPEAVTEPAVMAEVADVPSVDIRTAIGINDKYLFITELFKDDRAAYDEAIKKLNGCTSLQQALRYAEEELQPAYDWDKETPAVQSFYTLLSNSFPST